MPFGCERRCGGHRRRGFGWDKCVSASQSWAAAIQLQRSSLAHTHLLNSRHTSRQPISTRPERNHRPHRRAFRHATADSRTCSISTQSHEDYIYNLIFSFYVISRAVLTTLAPLLMSEGGRKSAPPISNGFSVLSRPSLPHCISLIIPLNKHFYTYISIFKKKFKFGSDCWWLRVPGSLNLLRVHTFEGIALSRKALR